MERAFTVNENCRLFQDARNYEANLRKQKEFVRIFCEENGIESDKYYIGGDGSVNVPFGETRKKDITFGIIPTENDKQKFAGQLRVPNEYDVTKFKKSSKIAKLFADQCVAEEIVINIWKPRPIDYFRGYRFLRTSSRCFGYEGILYVSIAADGMENEDVPDGFTEIKMSELYKVIEEIEAKGER